jgi:large subunit ribosomal protein L16
MLLPNRVKFRKMHRLPLRGKATRGTHIAFGDFAMQATTAGRVTSRQIEAARIAMTRHIKRGGNIWIRIFPQRSITKKPLEVRMGKGKGGVDHWVAQVRPGTILYEMDGVDVETAKEAMRLAGRKLAIGTRFVTREQEI